MEDKTKSSVKYFAICKHCKDYDRCKMNNFQYPVYNKKLPVYSDVTFKTLELYNNIKKGFNYTSNDVGNLSNKILILLGIMTNRINNNQMSKFNNKE